MLGEWWAKLVRNLPAATWTPDQVRLLGARANELPPALGFAIRGLLAKEDESAKRGLLARRGRGSLLALEAFGKVTELSSDIAAAAIASLAEHTSGIIERAHEHTYGPGQGVGEALALLSTWHPDVASWDPVYQLLEDPLVSDTDKSGALAVLANNANRLPAEVQARLKPIATALAKRQAPVRGFALADNTDVRGIAVLLEGALGALDETDSADRLIALLRGDAQDRQWAVHVAYRPGTTENTGILIALTDDEDVQVRASAASALAALVADESGGALATTALLRASQVPGVLVPQAIASALSTKENLPTAAAKMLEELRTHPSGRVRALALGDASSYSLPARFTALSQCANCERLPGLASDARTGRTPTVTRARHRTSAFAYQREHDPLGSFLVSSRPHQVRLLRPRKHEAKPPESHHDWPASHQPRPCHSRGGVAD